MSHPTNGETVLWLIRHPEPDEAVRGICCGSLDVPLSKKGIDQAQGVARWLSKQRLDAIYTSPSQRCVDMARWIAASRSCSVESVDTLRELNFGDFEGRSYDDIAECYPDLYREWMERPTEVHFPNGESFRKMADRVNEVTRGLVARRPNQHIAFVTHGGPIRIILGDVLGIEADRIFRIGQSYGAINRVRYSENSAIVELMNSCPEF